MEIKILKSGNFKVKLAAVPDDRELSWLNKLTSGPGSFLVREENGTQQLVYGIQERDPVFVVCPFFCWFSI